MKSTDSGEMVSGNDYFQVLKPILIIHQTIQKYSSTCNHANEIPIRMTQWQLLKQNPQHIQILCEHFSPQKGIMKQ